MRAFFSILVTVLTLLICPFAYADDGLFSKLRVNGFGTLGLTKGGNDNIGVRDTTARHGSFDEWSSSHVSKLGLQLDYQFTDKLSAGIQAVAKHRDVENELNDAINWAYLDYQLTPSLSVRIGRIAQDLYLVSDHREIGYSQPWAHTPMEFYSAIGDTKEGIQLCYKKSLGDGYLLSKFAFGKTNLLYLNSDTADTLEVKPNFDINLEWSDTNWVFRFTHSRGKISSSKGSLALREQQINDLVNLGWSQLQPFVGEYDISDTWIKYYSAGVSYTNNDWIIQSEFNYSDTASIFLSNIKGAYLLVGKRFDNVTPFVMLAKGESDRVTTPAAPAPFLAARQAVDALTGFLPIDQKTLSLGFRWDLKTNIALKTQWDRTWIEPRGSYLYDVIHSQTDGETINRYTLAVDFVF